MSHPAPHPVPPSPPRGDKPGFRARLRDGFASTPRTLALVWQASRSVTLGLGGLTLAGATLPLAVAWVGKAIIDAVVAGDRDAVLRWVLVELGVVALLALTTRGLGLARSLLGARLSVDVNVMILRKALTLELRHFEDTEFYDRLTRARREASSRPVSVVTSTFQFAQNTLLLAGYVALLLGFSGWAVLGLALAALPATISELRFSSEAFRLRNWRAPETRRLNYLEYVLANDGHAKEVRLFGLGPMLLGRYAETAEGLYREDRALAWRRALWGYLLSLLGSGAFYACYLLIALAAVAGEVSLGTMTLYVVAFRQGQQAFQSILGAIGTLYEDNLYMSNLFAYLAMETGPATPAPTPEKSAAPVDATERGVRFEGVGFQYPDQSGWALRGVDLFIPAGRSLALVGQNGAGKTTFIKLLTRLYAPTEGRILLDGRDLRDWDATALQARIGVIFQDFNRYQLTARENVGVGSVDDLDDLQRVERAVERGGASDDVSRWSRGLETPLGRWFKDGTELSGGQWQKIALSRAFMREQADILVLDEPTAALDAEAEHTLFERFRQLTQGRTTLLISHRFPTVRMADHIVVLEGGHIVEQGTHDALLAADGRYAHLFALQASGYA
jgi:ATP-binding cassette subfamily B protein